LKIFIDVMLIIFPLVIIKFFYWDIIRLRIYNSKSPILYKYNKEKKDKRSSEILSKPWLNAATIFVFLYFGSLFVLPNTSMAAWAMTTNMVNLPLVSNGLSNVALKIFIDVALIVGSLILVKFFYWAMITLRSNNSKSSVSHSKNKAKVTAKIIPDNSEVVKHILHQKSLGVELQPEIKNKKKVAKVNYIYIIIDKIESAIWNIILVILGIFKNKKESPIFFLGTLHKAYDKQENIHLRGTIKTRLLNNIKLKNMYRANKNNYRKIIKFWLKEIRYAKYNQNDVYLEFLKAYLPKLGSTKNKQVLIKETNNMRYTLEIPAMILQDPYLGKILARVLEADVYSDENEIIFFGKKRRNHFSYSA